jgi:hypothetical protein
MKKTRIVTAVISGMICVAVSVMLVFSEKEPVVNILDDGVQIKAVYGLTIDFSDITDIYLIEKSMRTIGVGRRTNGYGGFGETLKGHFKSNSLGEILLFVRSKSSPTIRIERCDKKDVYISFRDGENTERLYHEMKEALSRRAFQSLCKPPIRCRITNTRIGEVKQVITVFPKIGNRRIVKSSFSGLDGIAKEYVDRYDLAKSALKM